MRRYLAILTSVVLFSACNQSSTKNERPPYPKAKLSAKQYADSAQDMWVIALSEDSMYVDKALALLDSAITLDPKNPMPSYVKASYLSQMGLYKEALDIYTTLDDKHQVDYSTYSVMGMLYYRLGMMDSSVKYVGLSHQSINEKIEATENPQEQTHLKMLDAILLIMQDKKAEAIRMLEDIAPADEAEAGYLNNQVAELKGKTKEDIVEDMLPTDRSMMFERNKKINQAVDSAQLIQ